MMRVRFIGIPILVLAGAVVLGRPSTTFGQFESLLKRIAGRPNALVVMDVDQLYKSPLAVEKQWKQKFVTNWQNQPILLPPEARRIVLASHLNPLRNLEADWEMAVLELSEPVTMNSIARSEGGYVDVIDRTPVVWTPSHAYFIQLERQVLGLVYPDDRQAVSRWIAFNRLDQTGELSPYLRAAAQRAGVDGQLVMAVDLKDVLQPHRLDKAIKESKVLAGRQFDRKALADALASIQGVTLVLEIQSQARAMVRVDFAENIEIAKPFAKELVLEAVARLGAQLPDQNQWKVTVEEKAIVFHGSLSQNSLERVGSLFELPTAKFSMLKGEADSHQDSASAVRDSSKRYFASLDKLIVSLREGIKTPGTTTLWLEKSAKKIDALPILNVDEELLGFGGWCSRTMRQMAEGVRGVTRSSSIAETQIYGNYYAVGNYGGTGYYRSNANQQATLDEQTRASAGSVRTKGVADINNALSDMRRKMTKKYGVEF